MPIRKRGVTQPDRRDPLMPASQPTERGNLTAHQAAGKFLPEAQPVAVVQAAPELIPGYGNISHEDLVVPRMKLLQGMSPECKPDGGSHPQGLFFHSSEGRTLGRSLQIVSLGVKKTLELWAPRGSQEENEGILARSSDGVNWDKGYANKEIVIHWEDGPREIWRTRENVAASGFTKFRNGKPPICGFTYRLALYLPEYPQYPASLMLCTKTATQPVLDLNGRLHSRYLGGTPFWQQAYQMEAVIRKGKGKLEWFIPRFSNLPPLTDPLLIDELKARSEAIYRANRIVATDEAEEEDAEDDYRGRERAKNSTY